MQTLRRRSHDLKDDEAAIPRRRLNSRSVFQMLNAVRYLEIDAADLKTFDRVCPRHHVVLTVTAAYLLRCPASKHLVETWWVVDRQTGRIVADGTIRLDEDEDECDHLAGEGDD